MGPSVLVVDDQPAFRAMARALLASDVFTVVGEAVEGALEGQRQVRPDVAFLAD